MENTIQFVSNDHLQLKSFFAGGVGGMCTVILGYPFDTIKVKLQAMPPPPVGEAPLYSGTWDCAVKTVKKDGFLGLYRGMSAPIAGIGPIFAISFLSFSAGKRIANSADDAVLSELELFCAGAFSGFFTAAVMAPGERIKCLLQVQHDILEPKVYKGPVDVIRQLYREGGLRSIYRGTVATLLRDVPGCGLYFMTYEWLQRKFRSTTGPKHVLATMFSGGMAGIFFWTVACPADVVKTRLQTAPEGRYPNGTRDVFRQLVREEGVAALYKGCVPIMARSFPANATCFVAFELAMHFMNKL